MKFFQDEQLAEITAEMTDATLGFTNNGSSSSSGNSGERVIQGRIEAYIMKRAKTDKKLAHQLSEKLQQDVRVADIEYASFKQTLAAAMKTAAGGYPSINRPQQWSRRLVSVQTNHIHSSNSRSTIKSKTKDPLVIPTQSSSMATAAATAKVTMTTTTMKTNQKKKKRPSVVAEAGTDAAVIDSDFFKMETGAAAAAADMTLFDRGVLPEPATVFDLSASRCDMSNTGEASRSIPQSNTVMSAAASVPVPLVPILKKSRSTTTPHPMHQNVSIGSTTVAADAAIVIPLPQPSSFTTTAEATTTSTTKIKHHPIQQQHSRIRSASLDMYKPRSSVHHHSTQSFSSSDSSSFDLHQSCNRKLMTDLILTLNASFPDYDFSSTRPSSFIHYSSIHTVIQQINDKLSDFNYSQRNYNHHHHYIQSNNNTTTNRVSSTIHTHENRNTSTIALPPSMTSTTSSSTTSPFLSLYYPSAQPLWSPYTSGRFSSSYPFFSSSSSSYTIPSNSLITSSSFSSSSSNTQHTTGDFLFRFWKAIDQVIQLQECEVYSYSPPRIQDVEEDDPMDFLIESLSNPSNNTTHTSSLQLVDTSTTTLLPLWTMNYFFVNKIRKRIVLFTCVSSMRCTTSTNTRMTTMDDDDDNGTTSFLMPNTRITSHACNNTNTMSPSSPGPFVVEPDDENEEEDDWEVDDEEEVGVSSLLHRRCYSSRDEEEGGDIDQDNDEEDEVDGDYDMEDCMIQAVSAPTL